jgi:hypothetical protein
MKSQVLYEYLVLSTKIKVYSPKKNKIYNKIEKFKNFLETNSMSSFQINDI